MQNNGLPKLFHPRLRSCEYVVSRGFKVAVRMKVVSQLTLKQRNYLNCSSGPKIVTRVIKYGRDAEKSVSECCEVRKTLSFTAGFGDERYHELRNTGSLQTLEKVRKVVLQSNLQKGTQPGLTPRF